MKQQGGKEIDMNVSKGILSERERACLTWVAMGKSSRDIAVILGLSEHTINFHVKRTMKKLDAGSRMVACIKATKLGLIGSHSGAPREPGSSVVGSEKSLATRPLASAKITPVRLRVGCVPRLGDRSSQDADLAAKICLDIATGLSRISWLAATLPAPRKQKRHQPFTELDRPNAQLDYIATVLVSSKGKDTQICVRLVDVLDGARLVWSRRQNVDARDIDARDRLVARAVAHLELAILSAEGEKPSSRPGADTLLHRAIRLIFCRDRASLMAANGLIDRAGELEPDNSRILSWAALAKLIDVFEGYAQDAAQALDAAKRLSERAVYSDPNNHETLAIAGHVCAVVDHDLDTAIHYFDRSRLLNPLSAHCWALRAMTHAYRAEFDLAFGCLDRYTELVPSDPYYAGMSFLFPLVHTLAGNYEQAVTMGRRAIVTSPELCSLYRPVIASLGHLGLRERAKPYVDKLLSLDPNFDVQSFGAIYPFKRADDRLRFLQGLRLAGVPECRAVYQADAS